MSSSIIKDVQFAKLNPKPVPVKGIQALQQRSYSAALSTNLLSDWVASNTSADIEARTGIKYIRSRTRDLERNEDYTRSILRACENNIVGHRGFKLRMKVKTTRGSLNNKLNAMIEDAYARSRKKGNWEVTGKLSGVQCDKLIVRSAFRDGDCLIRKIPGYSRSPSKFALQLIEGDQLDENYVWNPGPDCYIRMGVEMDQWRRPVAYHLWRQHPGDLFPNLDRIRIPAEEIVHPFITERIGATRGVSQMCSSAVRLRHLSKYEESEVVAARAQACKMVYMERDGEDEYVADAKDDAGNPIGEFSAGTIENLPLGVHAKLIDPTHPNQNYPGFKKEQLRGVASGVGVNYNLTFGDLEGVNFSSLRAGELDERDFWLGWQEWFISQVIEPIFPDWLKMAILSGQVDSRMVSVSDVEEIAECAVWRGRRWDWVDPLKDVQADIEASNAGLKSKRRIIESDGEDIEEIWDELEEENEMADERNLQFITDLKSPLATGKAPQDTQNQVDSGQPIDSSDGAVGGTKARKVSFALDYDEEPDPGETMRFVNRFSKNGHTHS